MTAKDILKDLIEAKRINYTALANRVGMARQNVWDRINGKATKEIKIEVLLKLLRAMDYKLVIMPINRKTPEDGFEVGEAE